MADQEIVKALRNSAGEVVRDHYPAQELHQFLESGAPYDRALWQKAAELGWLMIGVPEDRGGLGGGALELAVLQQALGGAVAPIPFLSTALFGQALSFWPEATLAEELLPQLSEGGLIAGVGQLSADAPGVSAIAIEPGYFSLTGTCAGILGGVEADWVLIRAAKTDGDSGIALLPARTEGIVQRTRPIADPTRTMVAITCREVVLSARHIAFGTAASALLGHLRSVAALLVAADSIGGARAVFDLTVDYLKTRTQFGKPIGSFQALKHRAADLAVRLEMATGLVDAALKRQGEADAAAWAAMAKFTAAEAYAAVAADAVQMHGGIGFTWEHRAHLYLKRATLNAMLFGDAAVQQDRLAAQLVAS